MLFISYNCLSWQVQYIIIKKLDSNCVAVFDEYTLTDSLLVELIDNVMKTMASKDEDQKPEETGKPYINIY